MSFFAIFFFVPLFFLFDGFYVFPFLLMAVFLFSILQGNFFGGVIFLDSLSYVLIFLSILIFFFCFSCSFFDFWSSNFFGSFATFLAGLYSLLVVIFSCFNFLVFYMSFEILFLLMFMFLLTWGYSPERLQASFYMIFYTIVVSFPFLVYLVLAGGLEVGVFGLFSKLDFYWWGFFVLVFLVKLPVYGAHLWLPKAHVEAPVSGSMLLAGVLLKLGGYGLIRFFFHLISNLCLWKGYLISLGLLGGALSCFLCMRQSDLKAFVAYSSVCHMGFALGGLSSASVLGYTGGVWMMIAHGFCSSCLFYLLYVFYERLHSRSLLILKGVGGVAPLLGGAWFLFSIINMGVPPFFSFFSEISILSSLIGVSLSSFLFSAVLLFFAGAYGIFLFTICFHGKGEGLGVLMTVSIREFLNFYSHFFFLSFFVISLVFFF